MFEQQIENFTNISNKIGGSLVVIGSHCSKSCNLPVVQIKTTDVNFTLRDNFYDINIFVELFKKVNFEYSDFYEEKDEDWYEETLNNKKYYTFRGWTEEEINDPRILRVLINSNIGTFWSSVSSLEKDRWLNRYSSTEWYSKDWSSGKLIKVDNKYYLSRYCFAEGIKQDNNLQPYYIGVEEFFLYANNITKAEKLIKLIYNKCLTN